MALDRNQRLQCFHEYVFAKAYENLNDMRRETHTNVMTIDEGKERRQALGERLVRPLAEVAPRDFVNGLNEVFGEPVMDMDAYRQYAYDFARITATPLKDDQENQVVERVMFPVSVFDGRFENQPETVSYLSPEDYEGGNGANLNYFVRNEAGEITPSRVGLSKEDRMPYFNEYVFARTFRMMNEDKVRNGEPVTMVSEGRTMHQRLIDAMVADGVSPSRDTLGSARWFDLEPRLKELFGDYAPNRRLYNQFAEEFAQYAGLKIKGRENDRLEYENQRDSLYVPLSPFDKRFENRGTFRELGSEMAFVKMDDINEGYHSGVRIYRESRGDMVEAGSALSQEDLTGLTRLRNFMTDDEYAKAKSWLANVKPEDRMSDTGIERAVAILEHLQSMGVDFSIETDSNPGQLKANLTHENMDVRLVDKRSAEGYVGRVYSSGRPIYYNVKTGERNGALISSNDRSDYKAGTYDDMTVQDTLDLIDYAMGRVVPRRDNPRLNVGQVNVRSVGAGRRKNDAYLSTAGAFSAIANVTKDGHPVVMYFKESVSDAYARAVTTPEAAKAKLGEAIVDARENFRESMDLDSLINAANNGEEPIFSGNDAIAATQAIYWDVLTGVSGTLLKPGLAQEEFDDVTTERKGDYTYSGTPEEIVRQHLADSVDYYIGKVDRTESMTSTVDAEGNTHNAMGYAYDNFDFDPVMVTKYMRTGGSTYMNDESLASWFRVSGLPDSVLRGEGFYNKLFRDKILQFDESSAVELGRVDDPVAQAALTAIKETLSTTGVVVRDEDIKMDSHGIVQYTGRRASSELVPNTRNMKPEKLAEKQAREQITGQIGQIFLPEANGLVKTEFNGSDNYYFAPGYRAYIVPQRPGEDLSLEERTRLKGYEQVLCDRIRRQIRQDAMGRSNNIGSSTSINNVYHQLYDERFSLDYLEKAQQEQMDQSLLDATIATVSRRVRYGSDIRDGSTINAEYEALKRTNVVMDNDNKRDPYLLTGRRNMAIMSEPGDGYFDTSATGTAYNQGVTRFLVEDAEVLPDGRIKRGSLDGKTPLMAHDYCKYMDYVPFDRRQMTFGNLIRAACVTKDTKTAQMTFGGWTFDDGYVVSKAFADRYRILGSDGNMRSLVKGDKISDMNGNKGVISLVVDPEMDPDEAREQGLEKPVAWFRANPELEVVGAPFAAPSRFNAGSARELMERPEDLVGPDGKVFEGCMGSTHYIVTHMSVDEKTHIYDDEDLAQGRGRKASAQLAWAFASQNANAVLRECYGTNNGAFQNMREMMICMGLDMDETGGMHLGYKPHVGEERKVFEIADPEDIIYETSSGQQKSRKNYREIRAKFMSEINRSGGMLELPFPLKMPSGEDTMKLSDVPGMEEHPTADMEKGRTTYALPVLSVHLRTGQELDDGSSVSHDYTRRYVSIAEYAAKYKQAMSENASAEALDKIRSDCQLEFDKITGELSRRVFSGKHNYVRDHIMANRMPDSATAVWTADPRLDIDQVAIGPAMAEQLNLKNDDYVLCWRDPMLRDAGVRYNRVKIDDTLIGVAINPVMDKSYDGDFDGDSIAVVKLHTEEAKADAHAKLTVAANLLDLGVKNPDGTHPLMMQDGLDLKSAQCANPDLKDDWQYLTEWANKPDMKPEYFGPDTEMDNMVGRKQEIMTCLNDYVHEALGNEYGTDMVSFKDMKSHWASIEHMVKDGAKGSYGKLKDYAKYMGVTYDMLKDENGNEVGIDLDSIVDHGRPLAERKDDLDVQKATAIKSFGTGIAGMYSQRGISVLRNVCPKAVLELTYPNTQGILQSKHDPIVAAKKYDLLKDSVRELWRGRKLEPVAGVGNQQVWKPVYQKDGKGPMQATPEEFVAQFKELYTSNEGLAVDINEDYIKDIADALKDPSTGRMMDIETDAKSKLASPMDQMAYGGTFETVKSLAEKNANLFEGRYNAQFMPYVVQSNVKAVLDGRAPRAVVKSDTKFGYERKANSKIAVAVGEGRKKEDMEAVGDVVIVTPPVAPVNVQASAKAAQDEAGVSDAALEASFEGELPCEQKAREEAERAEEDRKNNKPSDDGGGVPKN